MRAKSLKLEDYTEGGLHEGQSDGVSPNLERQMLVTRRYVNRN